MKIEGRAERDSVYGGGNPNEGFAKFLRRAEVLGLLPSWWSEEKANACKALGTRAGWSSLSSIVGKSDIIDHC